MSLSRTQKSGSPRAHSPRLWDEWLYKAIFASTTDTNLILGHYFHCVLDERTTKIDPAASPSLVHKYRGTFRLWLNPSEFCDIPVELTFEDSLYFNNFEEKFTWGCTSFSWFGQKQPYMTIALRNENGLGEQVAKLFAETKAAGGKGVELSWSAMMKDMVGLSAHQAWGTWEEEIEYDKDSKRITMLPVGRRAFELVTVSFEAQM